ncbi:MAG: hypothetical protein AB1453_07990 [Chloroflexota bacterium]|jgi:hypothetical protein
MNNWFSVRCCLLFFVLVALFFPMPVAATAPGVGAPPGFESITAADGVELYRKEYPGGTPDYVVRVNLAHHASLVFMHGETTPSTEAFTASPAFNRPSMESHWRNFRNASEDAFCLINGTFFPADRNPAPLTFGLKSGGVIVSEGLEKSDQAALLEIWQMHARITPYSESGFKESTADHVLVGLSPQAERDSQALKARTAVGVADADGDGQAETLLLFASKTTRQNDAVDVLRAFGAQEVMLLSDGDATQLWCNDQPYVYAEAGLPQVIGVRAGKIAEYEAVVVRQSEWPIAMAGESAQVEVILRNNGSQPWLPGEVYLRNQRNDWGAGERIEISQPVPPGDTTAFTFTTEAFTRPGVHTALWEAVRSESTGLRGERSISPRPIVINVIVLPEELADRKQELETQVREWARMKLDNIEQLVLEWIEGQVRRGFDQICPSAALLPLSIVFTGWLRHRMKRAD